MKLIKNTKENMKKIESNLFAIQSDVNQLQDVIRGSISPCDICYRQETCEDGNSSSRLGICQDFILKGNV